jgi:hypothetical protein
MTGRSRVSAGDPLHAYDLHEGDTVQFTVKIDNEIQYREGRIVEIHPDHVRVISKDGRFKVARRQILTVTRREES